MQKMKQILVNGKQSIVKICKIIALSLMVIPMILLLHGTGYGLSMVIGFLIMDMTILLT